MDNSSAEFNEDERAMLAALEKGDEPIPDAPTEPAVAAEPQGQAAPAVSAPVEGTQAAQSEPGTAAPQGGDPRAALRAARRDAKRANERAQQLEHELKDLKAGKAPVAAHVTDEEMAELEENFPVAAKLAREVANLKAKLQATTQAQPPEDSFEPVRYDPEIQEVIDSVPELVNWQFDPTQQQRFHAAIEMDKYLLTLPDWKDKPLNERLAEVTSRVKRDVSPGEPRRNPNDVINGLPTQGAQRISDFKGGMQPDKSTPDYSRMSDEEIIASLPQ